MDDRRGQVTVGKRGIRVGEQGALATEGDLGEACVCERQMCSITGRHNHRHDGLGTENVCLCHSTCCVVGAT